jgi:hypothetical protein
MAESGFIVAKNLKNHRREFLFLPSFVNSARKRRKLFRSANRKNTGARVAPASTVLTSG